MCVKDDAHTFGSDNSETSKKEPTMRVHKAGIALAGIALAAVTLLVAGCGGGSAAPGTTTRGNAQLDSQQVAHLEAFAACMRAHGVAHMPPIDGNGGYGAKGSGQVDLKSPAVKAAIKTCLPTADGLVGANLQPVGVTRTTPSQAAASHESATAPSSGPLDCDSVTTCYTPRQIQVAYGIRPLLERGIDGRGETVVLPELAETQLLPPVVSDLRQDMSRFDSLFGLPAARLKVVRSITSSASPWLANGEEVLDAENVHAVAPGAAITIVLVKSTSLNNRANAVAAATAAIRVGTAQGNVISISAAGQTGGEHCDTQTEVDRLNSVLQAAAARHVTVIAASGDIGTVGEPCAVIKGLTGGAFPPVKEVNLPAADPLVLATGGTSLDASHTTGAYISESAWGLPFGSPGTQFQASGGGFSRRFARPGYQNGVPGIAAARGVPDVSADASPHTGMALVITDGGNHHTIRNSGGTSASAPLWAGLIALADQYAGRHLGFVNPAIYRIGRSASYHEAFHDITTGNNTPTFPGHTINGYTATPGWDPVTGWGSPNAQALIPLLARHSNQ
jgi:subtilase family serine protease